MERSAIWPIDKPKHGQCASRSGARALRLSSARTYLRRQKPEQGALRPGWITSRPRIENERSGGGDCGCGCGCGYGGAGVPASHAPSWRSVCNEVAPAPPIDARAQGSSAPPSRNAINLAEDSGATASIEGGKWERALRRVDTDTTSAQVLGLVSWRTLQHECQGKAPCTPLGETGQGFLVTLHRWGGCRADPVEEVASGCASMDGWMDGRTARMAFRQSLSVRLCVGFAVDKTQ